MRLRLLATVAIATLFGISAHADTTSYLFNVSGQGISASGTVQLTSTNDPNIDQVTGISGQFSSSAAGSGSITGLVPGSYSSANPSSFPQPSVVYDNLVYLTNTTVTCSGNTTTGQADYCGVLFLVNTGASSPLAVNIFSLAGGGGLGVIDGFLNGTTDIDTNVPVTFTVATTPEPSSLALLGTGILGVIGAARRRIVA